MRVQNRSLKFFCFLVALVGFSSAEPAFAAGARSAPQPAVALRPAEDAALARRLVDLWGSRRSMQVSAKAAEQIATAITNFRQTYCHPSNNSAIRSSCESLLGSEPRLQQVADSYLDEASSKGLDIVSFYARLAEAIGSSAQASGWPRTEHNLLKDAFQPKPSGKTEAVSARRGIKPHEKWYCLSGEQIRISGATIPIGRLPEPDLSIPATSPFLQVQINDPAKACSSECEQRLENSIIESISVWRGACSRCPRATASIIRVADTYFISEWFDAVVDFASSRNLKLEQIILSTFGGNESSAPPEMSAMQLNIDFMRVRYEVLSSEKLKSICNMFSGVSSGWAKEMQAALCGRSLDAKAVLTVSLVVGDTPCGNQDEVVACANTEKYVQLSARGFSFTDSQGKQIFGSGDRSADTVQVLLHEVGHWFGVPHAQGNKDERGRTNIMEDSYNPSGQCFRFENLKMLESAVDQRSEFRAKSCQGLKYPLNSNK